MAKANKLIKGADLMLFIKVGSKYKSIGYATSHSLSLNSEVQEISSKDHEGKSSVITAVSGSLSTNNLYTSESYEELLDLMLNKEKLTVAFTLKKEDNSKLPSEDDALNLVHWTPNAKGLKCDVIIESLTANASNGEVATFEANFKIVSKIQKVTDLPQG